jgi:hypothetical protein
MDLFKTYRAPCNSSESASCYRINVLSDRAFLSSLHNPFTTHYGPTSIAKHLETLRSIIISNKVLLKRQELLLTGLTFRQNFTVGSHHRHRPQSSQLMAHITRLTHATGLAGDTKPKSVPSLCLRCPYIPKSLSMFLAKGEWCSGISPRTYNSKLCT